MTHEPAGAAAPESESDSPIQLDEAGRVAEDLPCVSCGYNLRTMSGDGDCPECGARVRRAIWVARLRWANPAWLRSMSYSVFWLTIGLAVVLCLLPWRIVSPLSLLIASPMVFPIPAVTIVWGAWQATHRDPDRRSWRVGAVRRAARLAVISGMAGVFVALAASPLVHIMDDAKALQWILRATHIAGVWLLAIGALTGLTFLAAVARRIGHAWLRLVWVGMLLAFAGLVSLVLVGIGADLLSGWSWDIERAIYDRFGLDVEISDLVRPIDRWFRRGGMMLVLGCIEILGITALPVLWWYRKRLRDAAAQSGWRASWSEGGEG